MLAHSFYPSDVRIRREASALRDAGWEVDVFCLRKPGEGARERVDGVDVYRVPVGRHRGSRLRYAVEYGLAFVALGASAARRTRSRRYAVVQVHTLPDFLVFAATPAKWLGARVLLDMHEIAPEFYRQKYGVGPRHPMVRLLGALEQASLGFADAALTVSEDLRDRFVERGADPERIALVTNSADERLFPAATGEYLTRGDVAAPLQLVYHGSLLPYYGIDLLIRALAVVGGRWPFTVELYGGGEAAEALRALAEECGVSSSVRFHGLVPQERLAGVLQRAGAGIVPTRPGPMLDLSLSNKLLEMACIGMPIVASALPSYRRHLGETAALYMAPGDLSALASALNRLAGLGVRERAALAASASAAYGRWRWELQRVTYLDVVERLRSGARVHLSGKAETPA